MPEGGKTTAKPEREADARRMREGKYALLLTALEERHMQAVQHLNELSGGGASSEDIETANLQAEVTSKRIELFMAEHDPTGAWKGERLGRDLHRDLRQREWERDHEGDLTITPEDERSHILIINMGELDRLNSSGDHSLGDQGLRLTAERIEAVTREVLAADPGRKDATRLSEAYDVYRYSGNDFVLNLREVDSSSAEEIRRRLSQEPVNVRAGEDPVPIVASCVSRADGISLLNDVDERVEDLGLPVEKILIQAMLDKVQTLNDIAKVEARSDRMVGKLLEVQNGSVSEDAARDFYEKFLKKSLGSAFRSSPQEDAIGFDSFKRLVAEQRGSLDLPPPATWVHFVAERSMTEAFEGLKARRAFGRSIELKIANHVAQEVLNKRETFGIIHDLEAHPPSTPDFEPPVPTRGLIELARLKRRTDEAVAHRQESPRAAHAAELAEVEHDLERAKRDPRTGLYGRGMYFKTLEEGLERQTPVATIAIDMAFLKYFDKEGGPETGNIAISKAAEILDHVAQDFLARGITVEAYRVGGDEFAITALGADERTLEAIVTEIREGARAAGRVPASRGAKAHYASEQLQFNYGIRHTPNMAALREELQRAGLPLVPEGRPGATNELAEYLQRLADKEVEIQKGVNRVLLLTMRSLEAAETGERRNLDLLLAYSQKAIFGEAGTDKIEEFVKRLGLADDRENEFRRVRAEALEFVIEQIDKKNRAVADYEHSLDRRLEDAVRLRYFEQRITQLEEEIQALEARLSKERESSSVLRKALAAAEEEKQAVLRLRARLDQEPPTLRGGSAERKAA